MNISQKIISLKHGTGEMPMEKTICPILEIKKFL